MNMKKKITTAAAAAAISSLIAVSAFAGARTDYEAKMYGYIEDSDAYMYSNHTDKMIAGVTDNGDGSYTVSFQPIEMGSISGYISSIETIENGESETSEDGYFDFTYEPNDVVFDVVDKAGNVTEDGGSGTLIEYTVSMSMGNHSTSQGAISINSVN